MAEEQDRKKIISVTMSQSLVARIDELVRDRVGRSRAQIIEDAVRWFLEFTVHKWNERGIYVNEFRVAFEPESLTSLFFAGLTPRDQYELGQTAGTQSPVADAIRLFHSKDVHTPEGRALALQMLQGQGWGAMKLHNGLIVIGSPFYPPHFLQGYLEALLGLKLELVDTNVKENVALRIIEQQ